MHRNYEECIVAARSELATARARLNTEISNYPTPIAGCDAQFNRLLEEREKVQLALLSLDHPVFIPTPRSPSPYSGVESR